KSIAFTKTFSANNSTASMDKVPSEIWETPVATDNKIIWTPYDSEIDNFKTKFYSFGVLYGSNIYILINSDNWVKANGKYECTIPSFSRLDDSVPHLMNSSAVSGPSDNLNYYLSTVYYHSEPARAIDKNSEYSIIQFEERY
ncbi:MAG TPA: hypothetical protein PLS66_11340, partial [Tepiditoga sp.]|nr:hypothetical protein [Tepiditoga sp.]